MANPLLLEHVDPKHRSPDAWNALADKLLSGVPKVIEQPAMTKRFKTPSRRFQFSFDWTAENINARVRLVPPIYKIEFGFGLLSYYSGLARWMLADECIRDCFLLTKCYPNCDVTDHFVSEWFEWTIWHEVGHAACGHLEVWNPQGRALEEFEGASVGTVAPSEANLRMALELDADVAACNFFFIEIANQIKAGLAKRRYGSEYLEPFLHDLGASFTIMFALWHQLGQGMRGSTHPSATERATVWCVNAVDALHIYAPGNINEYRDALLRGMTSMLYTLGDDGTVFVRELHHEPNRLGRFKELMEKHGMKNRRQMRLPLDFSGNNVKRSEVGH